jgi:hypothetical protein
MKKFIGFAAIAFGAHAGLALAQPVIIGPADGAPDGAPRSRAERSAPGEAGPQRSPGRSEREERPDAPRSQRGAQNEPAENRAREVPREQPQQREQTQREPTQQRERTQREQAQREQTQQREPQRERQGEQSGRRPTEQQTRPDARPGAPQTAQPQQPENRPGASDTARPGANPATPGEAQRPGTADSTKPGAAPAGQQSAQGAQAEPEKQRIADTVRQRIERNDIRPVENFGVSVSVGAELPSRIQVQPVPSEIVSIRPQYRDHRFTVSEREIVIVDPRTRRVVEVIERDGGGSRGGNVYAVIEQRRDLRRWRRPDTVVFEQGVVLPPSAPYYDLPTEIVERNPRWRGYQYVMTERDEVAIVEPRSRRIIDVVDKNDASTASATTASNARQPSNGASDRHEITRIIMRDAKAGDITGVESLKGAVLSPDIALRPIPVEAVERDGQLRGYDYALLGDDVLIVDPKSREVIDVIE